MDLAALSLATDLGGHLLAGPEPAHTLILLERSRAHGLPTLLVLGRTPTDLTEALSAWDRSEVSLNVALLLPARATQLPLALPFHRLRLGALVGAVDTSLPWLEEAPMMPKRLPGRLRASRPLPLDPTHLRPLERADLRAHLRSWDERCLNDLFIQPPWEAGAEGFSAPWWPEVPRPAGSEVLLPSLVLPSQAPFPEALRSALRACSPNPVPWLPHPGDPSGLLALRSLTPELAAFRGPEAAWRGAFERLSKLPAPPHFCARC